MKTIKSTTTSFILERNILTEVDSNPYFLTRQKLKEAIKQKKSLIGYQMRYIDGSCTSLITTELKIVKKSRKVVRIHIGCKTFTGENVRALYSWATKKSR